MYQSRNPTQEKRRLYAEMERLKDSRGNVSSEKLSSYLQREEHYVVRMGRNTAQIRNKRGTPLGGVLSNKKRIKGWYID